MLADIKGPHLDLVGATAFHTALVEHEDKVDSRSNHPDYFILLQQTTEEI